MAASWHVTTTTPCTRTTTEVVSPINQQSAVAVILASTRTPNTDQGPTRPAVCLPRWRTTGNHADLPPSFLLWRRNRSSKTLKLGSTLTTACPAATRVASVVLTQAIRIQVSICVHWSRIPRRHVLVTSSTDYVFVTTVNTIHLTTKNRMTVSTNWLTPLCCLHRYVVISCNI